jgi:hypothetical protein
MDYAIDVTRTPIHLKTLTGEEIDAAAFVHPVGHADYRPESVGDRLNDPEAQFLPCEIDGEKYLVRLESVSYVVTTDAVPEVESMETVGAIHSQVELWLRSGERLQGDLIYEAERGEERVSDMLNRSRSRFLVLIHGDRTYFVLRDAVDRVKV